MKPHADDRSRMRRCAHRGLAFAVVAALTVPALAEDDASGSTYGRVRYFEGSLTIEVPAEGEIVEGTINSPVIPGDRLATTSGRAEIELADSSVVWMDGDSRLEFRTLADIQNRYERTNLLALMQGSIRVEARDPEDQDSVFQIDTEAGSVYLLSGGAFRIDAAGGSTTISSYGGVAEFSGDGGSVLIRSGQRSSVQIGLSPSNPRPFNTQRLDDFDRFCADRADAFLRQGTDEAYPENLPEEVRPYAPELSFYGTWRTLPTYGVVWRPHYAGVWSPYHHGYWSAWRGGWVWVSYDPWGWAPYHYGRWDHAADIGWFWVPGGVWSGAWVSFAVGPSYIGWCPLNYWNVPVFHDTWIVSRPTVNIGRLDTRGWHFVPAGRFGLRASEAVVIRGDRLPRNTYLVVTQRLPQFDPRVIAKRPERAAGLVDAARRGRVAPPVSQRPSGDLASFREIERRTPRGPIAHTTGTRPDVRQTPVATSPAGRPAARPPRTNARSAAPSREGTSVSGTQSSPPAAQTPSRPPSRVRTGQDAASRGKQEGRSSDTAEQPADAQAQKPGDSERGKEHAMERLFGSTRTKPSSGPTTPPSARVNPTRTTDPSEETSTPPPPRPSRGVKAVRRPPEKKPAPPPDPPAQDDSPEPRPKRR